MAVTFRNNKLFRGVDPTLLDQFDPLLSPTHHPAGSIIIAEGDSSDCMFLIGSGTVRISKVSRGSQQEVLTHLTTDDFFGEVGLYAGEPRSAQAAAVGPVTVACVGRDLFQEMMRLAPAEISRNLLSENLSRLRHTDSQLVREVLQAERMSLMGSMLSTVVHDIRGPLSVISMISELLSEAPVETRRDYPEKIRRAIRRINDMTQELLDYSKGTPRLALEPVSPSAILAELREEVLPPLQHSRLEVQVDCRCVATVNVDRNRFFRVLQNIIKNAVEAMPDGGLLSIVADCVDGKVVFRISDTGTGIPPEILPTIFEPFVTHGKVGGTGLGMAIARSVIEAHGGQVEVESTVGTGTTFTITLPASGSGLESESRKAEEPLSPAV